MRGFFLSVSFLPPTEYIVLFGEIKSHFFVSIISRVVVLSFRLSDEKNELMMVKLFSVANSDSTYNNKKRRLSSTLFKSRNRIWFVA